MARVFSVFPSIPTLAAAGLIALAGGGVALADVVHLANGSQLVGTVEGVSDGKLKIKTDYAGTFDIDMKTVKGISTDQPVNVRTKDGEVKVGKLAFDPANGQTTVAAQAAGGAARAVTMDELTDSWTLTGKAPDLLAAEKAAEAAKPKWTFRAEIGLNGQTGNQERFALNGGLSAKRSTLDDRLSIFAAANYAVEDGDRTADEILGGARYEYDLSDRWFVYTGINLEYDQFEDLDLRVQFTAGFGYFIIKQEKQTLKARGGAGFQHESFGNGTNTDQGIAELGVEYDVDINDYLHFSHRTTYFPSFEEIGDYRIVMENAVELPISKEDGWKLRAGIRNEFDDQPVAGIDRLDTFYFMNVAWDLVR
jgi:putative salt-induced outer membrane protein YdiY